LWKQLDVKYDEWAETTSERHKKVVGGILQRLFDEGQIYKDKQAGYYSVRQEQFLTDKERGADGQFGPEWGEIEFREEENYYFRLSQHKEWLHSYLDHRKNAVIPDFRQTELRNAVEKISNNRQSDASAARTSDLCISRPKSRLDWGIELPFDKGFVTYVWFDALTNYISFAGYTVGEADSSPYNAQPSTFRDKWPALQVIGKDILVPAHGIYWLIMLHAIGFPDEAMPQLLVHGWWNLGGAKMSKSAGNIIDPFVLVDKYGADALRYYLMSDIATGQDADFSEERLIATCDSDLANVIGNLVNRTLTMVIRYRDGRITHVKGKDLAPGGPGSVELQKLVEVEAPRSLEVYAQEMTSFQITKAAGMAVNLGLYGNGIVEVTAPWRLAKDSSQDRRLDSVLYHLVELVRVIAILISPLLPRAAHGIFDQLNWKMELSGKEERFSLADVEWGGLPDGHVVGKPVPLFPRIEP